MEYVQFQGIFTSFPIKMGPWYIHTQSQTNPSQRMFLLTVLAFAAEDSTIESWWKLWLVEPRIVRLQKSEVIIFLYTGIFHIREAFTKNQILLEVSERFHISLPKMKPILIIVKLHPQQENLKRSCDFFPGSSATSFTGFPEGGDSTLSRWSKLLCGAEPSSMTYSRKMGRSNGFGAHCNAELAALFPLVSVICIDMVILYWRYIELWQCHARTGVVMHMCRSALFFFAYHDCCFYYCIYIYIYMYKYIIFAFIIIYIHMFLMYV